MHGGDATLLLDFFGDEECFIRMLAFAKHKDAFIWLADTGGDCIEVSDLYFDDVCRVADAVGFGVFLHQIVMESFQTKGGDIDIREDGLDRKSTRLNTSHLCATRISISS